jgi:hypothetical protein
MQGIPLSNGAYKDLAAQTSEPNLRAWGQRDDTAGRMHLWIQNMQHTWTRVVAGDPITPIAGSVTIPNVSKAIYCATWWNTYAVTNPIFLTQALTSSGALTLNLPAPLSDDVAVQIRRVNAASACK